MWWSQCTKALSFMHVVAWFSKLNIAAFVPIEITCKWIPGKRAKDRRSVHTGLYLHPILSIIWTAWNFQQCSLRMKSRELIHKKVLAIDERISLRTFVAVGKSEPCGSSKTHTCCSSESCRSHSVKSTALSSRRV